MSLQKQQNQINLLSRKKWIKHDQIIHPSIFGRFIVIIDELNIQILFFFIVLFPLPLKDNNYIANNRFWSSCVCGFFTFLLVDDDEVNYENFFTFFSIYSSLHNHDIYHPYDHDDDDDDVS